MKKANLKKYLREIVLPELAARCKYFSTEQIRKTLNKHRVQFAPATLNRYLHDLLVAGIVHDAGRGWYSSLPNAFQLDKRPVESLIQDLEAKFPLLTFSCWSTEQIKAYVHHLLARFVTFVYVPRDAMETVFEHLRDSGYQAYLNLTRQEAAKMFTVGNKTVVVRPIITKEPVHGRYATVEKALVDLFMEMRVLGVMDIGEYRRMIQDLAGSGRISIGSFAAYAERRKVALKEMFGDGESIIST